MALSADPFAQNPGWPDSAAVSKPGLLLLLPWTMMPPSTASLSSFLLLKPWDLALNQQGGQTGQLGLLITQNYRW